ncbi:hypothetical protein DTO271D3_5887 [Paecilomyces variotii]|nr:hypothetical protein DTO169C6_4139 [Paecilomyces variotii]KAJ9246080.1 hypothetical protein DTO169E5_204 [Paecilomyces variotii]KAJ9259106.1 hypothetical protein DTO207G8_1266 [Paecilomyces variotii]KAJ9313793.1 hypothetical protein DTO271D3_5887 [Paecilomyces variotii]KAJ9383447.1 hypothetical protein DTO063F5_5283 [Paecilomyces variotii]
MADELRDVKPGDVTFLQKLKESENSVVFKVAVHGKICVMKVYHTRCRTDCDPTDYEIDLFICESTAYRRLKAKGLCKRGVIPDFYGTITNIQPNSWPDLHMFVGDKLPPNAVLIEYVANMQQISLDNFSELRLEKLRRILDEIHQAKVLHGDPKPRNMMVVSGEQEQDRVLWVDFDSAQTFPEEEPLSPKQELWFREEVEMIEYFNEALAQDFKEGKLDRAYSYYYEWYVK